MAKLNHELLAIILDRNSLDGAFSKAKSNARQVRSQKHSLLGKTIAHRHGSVERKYSKSRYIESNILNIRLMQDFLIKNNYINKNKTMEYNLGRIGYTLEEANVEVDKFKNICEIEVLFNRKEGENFAFRLFAGEQFNIKKYKQHK
ncbi:MAG: hypothetical protein ACRCXT_17970 [Paraclostridium sp.]